MKYKPWPKKERIYYSDLVYAVTGETMFARRARKFIPLLYHLAIANRCISIGIEGLSKAGLLGGKK